MKFDQEEEDGGGNQFTSISPDYTFSG